MFAPGDPLELALLEDMQGLGLDGGAGLADPLISKLISTLAPARRTRWRAAMDEIGSPYDRSFCETVGRVEVARDFLAYNLPPELLAAVELETLEIATESHLAEDLRASCSDLVDRRRGRDGGALDVYPRPANATANSSTQRSRSAGVTIASYACHRVIRVPANFKTLGMGG